MSFGVKTWFFAEPTLYSLMNVIIRDMEPETSDKAGKEEENGKWRRCMDASSRAWYDIARRKEGKDERLPDSRNFWY